uniref:50S ribosomal protein L16 n=1 Tax=Spongospora subterranea TaxID=70186 RepID=A0A096XTW3_9EUKA|nr:50S ribosomal protein L16 [Spongospora subterranea]AIK19940.1 50S ribosomal protein L16 [Spongospora subterranea]
MNFIPKTTKFLNYKKKIKNLPTKNLNLVNGTFGLKANQNCFLTSKQIEMIKLNLAKGTKKAGRYWIRVFPHFSVTAKPLEVRMGKGKGYIDHWICKIKRGSVICELFGLPAKQASFLLKKISLKLPVRTIYINKFSC